MWFRWGSENMFDLLDSDDREKLSRVINARCTDLNTRADSVEGQMLAGQLLDLFQADCACSGAVHVPDLGGNYPAAWVMTVPRYPGTASAIADVDGRFEA